MKLVCMLFRMQALQLSTFFRLYGDHIPGVQYFVGRENPTVDTLSCLEAGYVDDTGQPVV